MDGRFLLTPLMMLPERLSDFFSWVGSERYRLRPAAVARKGGRAGGGRKAEEEKEEEGGREGGGEEELALRDCSPRMPGVAKGGREEGGREGREGEERREICL